MNTLPERRIEIHQAADGRWINNLIFPSSDGISGHYIAFDNRYKSLRCALRAAAMSGGTRIFVRKNRYFLQGLCGQFEVTLDQFLRDSGFRVVKGGAS